MKNDEFKPSEGSLASQRAKLLAHLQQYGSITTVSARDELSISHTAGRVHEQRWLSGFDIQTVRATAYDQQDRLHLCACYILKGAPC
jgi:hypothetical protein